MSKLPCRRSRRRRSARRDRAEEYLQDLGVEMHRVTASGQHAPARTVVATTAGLQSAIGVLSAGLDSTELQDWAIDALVPRDADGLSDFLTALYVLARVLLGEVRDATGQHREQVLQRLALAVENGRGKPLSGW